MKISSNRLVKIRSDKLCLYLESNAFLENFTVIWLKGPCKRATEHSHCWLAISCLHDFSHVLYGVVHQQRVATTRDSVSATHHRWRLVTTVSAVCHQCHSPIKKPPATDHIRLRVIVPLCLLALFCSVSCLRGKWKLCFFLLLHCSFLVNFVVGPKTVKFILSRLRRASLPRHFSGGRRC